MLNELTVFIESTFIKILILFQVTGPQPPHPVVGFAYFGFDEALMKVIRKSEYTTPTPIQAQAVPAALSGRDIIGIAKTGSGMLITFIIKYVIFKM